MLLVKKTENTKNILRMPKRCRNFIPVSKNNRGNKKNTKNIYTQKIPGSNLARV
jgi:hypothetical protein